VSDLVDGFMRLMAYDDSFPGAVNLGNPIELTVSDLAERVLAMTGSSSRIVTRPLPVDDPRRRRPDISLAKKLLAWSPRTSLDVGLKATIAWFAEDQSDDNKAARMGATLANEISAGRV
jgi:UDP-glucuronate decarboxylase